jgi:serine/threonine protein kinase/tetratricopeptide (TPR) repeat protein
MNEESLFHLALQQDSGKRAEFLRKACAGDPDLQHRLEVLLHAHEDPGSFLQAPAAALDTTLHAPLTERPGTVIGPYKLLEQIGEGGFGLVFMAEQQEPIRRKVAIKVLKPGMDSRQVLARFDAERQALALMDHPNIAKVLDGGQTSSGRPYFVMDLVKGLPITEYCDQSQLTPRERLEIFLSVCQAVQHAHQKGIIHRDLKPSNILVTLHDGAPLVKVIDFGIAKALGQQLTDKTLFTNFAQMIGTPLYMSPEQAAFGNVDVDTRSDIYSLGVLLYELLTGTAPFEKDRFRKVAYDEICRIIREEDPPKPSTRISTLGQAATTVSTNRKTHPKRLSQLFRGELDWIVMKALEKDRERRYESASAFAADVQRYLHDEPVQACPPSAWYRFRKFARRNRARLALAACLFAVVFGFAGSAVWFGRQRGLRQAETERGVTAALTQADALVGEGDTQIDHPERWQSTALRALAAQEKAEELLAAGVGTEELAERVRQVRLEVDEAVADSRVLVEIDRIRLEQAAVKGGKFDQARAAPLYAELLRSYGVDPAAPEAAAARVRDSRLREALLAALGDWRRFTQDEGERQRVARVYELALPPNSLREKLMEAGKRRDTADLEKLVNQPSFQDLPPATVAMVASELDEAGQWAAAEKLLRAAQERKPGDFWLNHLLGHVLSNQGPSRVEEALRYWTAALALRSDSPGVYLNLGGALHDKGDVDGAIRSYQAALRINPRYAQAHFNLGNALRDKGQVEEAIAEYREALGSKQDFPEAYKAHHNLGVALRAKGQLEEAIAEYREALRSKQDSPLAHTNLGNALRAKGQLEEAIAEYRQALRSKQNFPEAYKAHSGLGNALMDKGQLEEAIAEYREALRIKKDDSEAHSNFGVALMAKGQLEKAIAEYREALRIRKDDPVAHSNLGNALRAKGQTEEAIAECREALRIKKGFPEAHSNLGNALMDEGQLEEAIAEYREALRIKKDDPGDHCNLAHALRAQGDFLKALEEYRCGHELGSKQRNWQYPSAQWVQECERLVELDKRLPSLLEGRSTPTGPSEGIELAQLCSLKRLNRAALRFYEHAFNTKPELKDDMKAAHRYNAACAAALAGCGEGKDAEKLNEKERAHLRGQALDWLRADLEARARVLHKEPARSAAQVTKVLRHSLADPDLAGVRGPEALAKLPEPEREPWQELWSHVADTLARAQAKTTPEKKAK